MYQMAVLLTKEIKVKETCMHDHHVGCYTIHAYSTENQVVARSTWFFSREALVGESKYLQGSRHVHEQSVFLIFTQATFIQELLSCRVRNCAFLVASATKNLVLVTRISQLVASGQPTINFRAVCQQLSDF